MSSKKSSPPPPLQAFGMLVRETRIKRGLTQERAATGARVSRKQWALLEQGSNVSAEFIQKVAAFLDIRVIPFGDRLEAVIPSGGGVDVTGLLKLADEFLALAVIFADRIRAFAVDAALPPSERTDAQAIASLVAARGGGELNPDIENRLRRTMQHLAVELSRRPVGGRPATVVAERTERRARRGATKREG